MTRFRHKFNFRQVTESNLLSTNEVARRCRCSARTILRWVRRGDLAAHQLPGATGALVFNESDVNAFTAALVELDEARWGEPTEAAS